MPQRDRELFLREMQAGVGLSAAPATLIDFEHWVGGAESPSMRHSMATYRDAATGVFSSTCGLGIRDALRRAGFTARWLQPAYVVGSVMSSIKDEGARAHAVQIARPAEVIAADTMRIASLPAPGDIFGLGWAGADAHVAVVETSPVVDAAGVVTFDAVEAGQIDQPLHQACARKRHTWTWDPKAKRYTDRSRSLTPGIVDGTHAREVSWWIDVSMLPAGGPTAPFRRATPTSAEAAKTDPAPPPSATETSSRRTSSSSLPTLRRGASGDDVRKWQGIIGATVDGSFGPSTERETKAWQEKHGLAPDGVVGAATWAAAGVGGVEAPATASARPGASGGAPIEGIDVSSIQGVIDWPRVKAAGISFAYVRATIGLGGPDSRVAQNCAGARAVGLDVGVYGVLYPRHGRAQDAGDQAHELVAAHRAHGCTLRPMIDFESLADTPGATTLEWLTALDDYCASLAVAGFRPLIYTYPSFWRGLGAAFAHERWANWPLWIAHYTHGAPDVPPPWTRALVWQYAASAPGFEGRVDGVPGLVDRNRLFGSLDDLRVQR